MKISVVIPAFNEEGYLEKALTALEKQTFPKKDFEVIVADNNSTDNTAKIARSFKVVLVNETRQGTNWARQAGFEKAKSPIVAFLDADCIPPINWLSRINRLASSPKNKNVGIITGMYIYYDLKQPSKAVYTFTDEHIVPRTVKLLHTITGKLVPSAKGGNMIFRKKALKEIGGFDTSLTFWGDDSDTAKRIVEKGHSWLFDPKLIVYSSARRFEKAGKVTLHLKYAKAYLSQFLD